MQKKKNIQLLVLLVFLTLASAIAYNVSRESSSVKVDKSIFKVKDFKSIDKIVLESKTGKVVIKFNGTRWLINDLYDADRNLVNVLFATLQQAEPKRPIAAMQKDSLSKVMEDSGVKVLLYASDKLEKEFTASGNAQKTQAYFKEAEGSTPYLVVIPGYRVYVSGIFELDENGWRDKRVFNFNWQNFKTLKTIFPSKGNQDFKIGFIDQHFTIENLPSVDTAKMNNYLDAVSLLTADQFIKKKSNVRFDSLINTIPFVIVEVKDVADKLYQLSIYPKIKNEKSIIGKLGNDQIAIFTSPTIMQMFKNRDYFAKTQKPN